MRTFFASTLLVFGSLTFTACGGSELDPGAGNDPGTGTSTLMVDGFARARPRVANAHAAGDFDTELSVHVMLNGQDVATGTVTITSNSGKVPLTFTNSQGGRWAGTAAGYDEVYILDVVSGTDKVEGVRVDGPDVHIFDAPTAGASVDSTMPIAIKWTCQDTADSASIRTDNIDNLSIPDSGSYSLAPGGLQAERDKPKTNSIRLTRSNRVTPKGAAGGSQLTVSVENDLDVVALANPAL